MDEKGVKRINITHVINPHLFWFKNCLDPNPDLERLEKEFKEHVKAHPNMKATNNRAQLLNETIVLVYMVSERKWIRAEVDMALNEEVIVWSIDYGVPLKISFDLVVFLNGDLKQKCATIQTHVFRAGVANILPAEAVEKGVVAIRVSKWSENSVMYFNKLVEVHKCNPERVKFTFSPQFDVGKHGHEHVFGNLDMVIQNQTKSFGEKLCADKDAVEISLEKFEQEILCKSALSTHKIDRWLDNSRSIVVENGTNRGPPKEEPAPVKPIVIDQEKLLRKYNERISKMPIERLDNQTLSSGSSSTKQTSSVDGPPKTVQFNGTQANQRLKIQTSTENAQSSSSSRAYSLELPRMEGDDCLIQKLKLERIFVQNNQEEAIQLLAANFTKRVHDSLKNMDLKETYILQAYAWPNILRGNSVVIVDSKNRGKTMAYCPPICSLVQRQMEQQEKNQKGRTIPKMGATAIIVCSTSSVSKIADTCKRLLNVYNCNVVEAIGTRNADSVSIKLYNGCNILVATVPSLFALIKNTKHAIQNDKLKYIAFENFDVLLGKHTESCIDIYKELCIPKNGKPYRQVIVTSRTWTKDLQQFLNKNDAVLIIGNHIEAALYASVFEFRLCFNQVKLKQIEEYIKNVDCRKERTLIICNEFEEAQQVALYFRENNISHDLVKDGEYSFARVSSFWKNIEGVLICADEHLEGTGIKNAQHIIHYNLPAENFRIFMFRFSTMIDYYSNSFEMKKPKATSIAFYNEENIRQLPKLVELLIRDGQEVSPTFVELSKKYRELNKTKSAENKCYESICNFVFMHGVTDHHTECNYRHLMLKSDILNDEQNQMPSGTLRFHVSKMVSPTEYLVRPIKIKPAGDQQDWSVINGSNEFNAMDLQMQIHYKQSGNQKLLGSLELGQICVALHEEKYYRAQNIRIIEKKSICDTDEFELRFLDTGECHKRFITEIYALAEPFAIQALPGQSFNLHLVSITPADKEDDWDPVVRQETEKYLNDFNKRENDLIYEANVLFTIRNTIVVDIMRLISLKYGVVRCSLKKFLSDRGYGTFNNDNRQQVIDMANALGIKVVKKKTVETSAEVNAAADEDIQHSQDVTNVSNSESYPEEDLIESWASPWKPQLQKIEINTFYGPNNFFVTNVEKTKEVYDEINKYVKQHIEGAANESMTSPDINKYCLVNVDGGFDRGKILDIHYSDDDSLFLNIFLVDVGVVHKYDISNVYEIPDDLVQKFPFQAIWCNLVGIEAIGNTSKWSEEMIDNIYNEIDKYHHELYLHTISDNKAIKSTIFNTNITCYDVVLLSIHDNEQINLNNMLVENCLANYDPQTKHRLENIPNILETEEDWDDDSNGSWNQKLDNIQSSTPNCSPDQSNSESGFVSDMFGNFDEEHVIEFFEMFLNTNQPEPKPSNGIAAIAEEDEDQELDEEEEFKKNDQINQNDSTECKMISRTGGHQIEYMFKHQQIYWQQNEELVELKIQAHDNVKYGLEVTEDYLIYGTFENGVQKATVINFFGTVDCKFTLHEVRGLFVVVRLRKMCPILWPRLSLSEENRKWIQFVDTSANDQIEFFGDKNIKLKREQRYDDEDTDLIEFDDLSFSYESVSDTE